MVRWIGGATGTRTRAACCRRFFIDSRTMRPTVKRAVFVIGSLDDDPRRVGRVGDA